MLLGARGKFMAEVTKRKLALIYSTIVGFFLSIFGSHASAGEFLTRKPTVEAGSTKTLVNSSLKESATTDSPAYQIGILAAPATQRGILAAPATQTGILAAPATQKGILAAPATQAEILAAPATQKGILAAPAPTGAFTIDIQNAEDIEDEGMKGYVIDTAARRGMNPTQMSTPDINNLKTEYLLQQIKLLQNKVDHLQ